MNKKIANATEITIDNIHFKSKLEAKCYTLLKEAGLNFEYEKVTIELLPGFRPTFKLFEVYKKGTMERRLTKTGKQPMVRSISYTPDFVWHDNVSKLIIIETKGYRNDVYPYKKKLLFRYLDRYYENTRQEVYFFEPVNVTTLKQTIEIIKNILKNEKT